MPIALRGPRKAMREKCECGRGKCERGLAFSTPWPRFHGVDRADVYIIIRVRACCCGECALNSPTSPPIPRRRPSLAHAQRHARPEHFRSPTQRRRSPTQRRRSPTQSRRTPTQRRCTPAGCAMHSPPTHNTFPAEDFLSPPHSDTPVPSTSAPPRSADARPRSPDARPQAARCTPRSPHNPFPAAPRCPPSVPLRAQKNGTAQCMCDAECFGRPSLRSVVWVGEPRAVRRRCGALACRRGA